MTDPLIRPETFSDIPGIIRIVEAAFPTDAEARLVETIRASDRFIPGLSLVTEDAGKVVGHVMICYAGLEGEGAGHQVALLAPLAVASRAQGRRIGAALVRESVKRAGEMGEPLVVLKGSPRYYGALASNTPSRTASP